MEEIWIDIIGFDGIYQCSNLGRIKRLEGWVNIRGGAQRYIKESIRKQPTGKDGRKTCPLHYQGKQTSIGVSQTIFLSFNPKINYNPKKQCIMHIDKNQSNNRLDNLIVCDISSSHKANNCFNLLSHLHINNKKRTEEYKKLTHKTCKVCNENKKIELFDFGRNTCKKCKSKKQMENYYKTKPTD